MSKLYIHSIDELLKLLDMRYAPNLPNPQTCGSGIFELPVPLITSAPISTSESADAHTHMYTTEAYKKEILFINRLGKPVYAWRRVR